MPGVLDVTLLTSSWNLPDAVDATLLTSSWDLPGALDAALLTSSWILQDALDATLLTCQKWSTAAVVKCKPPKKLHFVEVLTKKQMTLVETDIDFSFIPLELPW